MFEFGFAEMLLTAVMGLLVLGPKRLPRAARTIGLWVRRARASWFSLRAELERELADEDMKASLRNVRDEVQLLKRDLQAPLEPVPGDKPAAPP
jgi:sec-independent protein translocase protein TatB